MGQYVLDDEEFKPSPDSEFRTTIGEYVEGLLSQEKYYNTVLPRLPMGVKRQLEVHLAPIGQYRHRTKSNKNILDEFRRPGTRVEADVRGDWLEGRVVEVDDDPPTRIKIRIRLEDGTEEYAHLGRVILSDGRRARSRSRSRGRGGNAANIDWSRNKGRTTKDLVDELRSRDRDRAVCSSGKEYARKPLGYKAACALPREMGASSQRLLEEETFVPMSRPRNQRSPSPDRRGGGASGKPPSAEHQARMQQLFEKYGNVRPGEAGTSSRGSELDQADFMRLG